MLQDEPTLPCPAVAPTTRLGGVGTGTITATRGGHLWDAASSDIVSTWEAPPSAHGTFLALRAVTPDYVYARILQHERGASPKADESPPSLPETALLCQNLFPAVDYRLNDPHSPVRLAWSVFSPVIPYDHEASALPVLLICVKAHNVSESDLDLSFVFNWDRSPGCLNELARGGGISVTPILLEESEPSPILSGVEFHNPRPAEEPGHEVPPAVLPRFNALRFDVAQGGGTALHRQYCLAAPSGEQGKVSIRAWNPCVEASRRQFWENFLMRGDLGLPRLFPEGASCGAVSAHHHLSAHEECTQHFVLAWYGGGGEEPRAGSGHSYTNRYQNAVQIARHALKHFAYYHQSIRTWHLRIQSATFPEWLNSALLNSLSCLAENAAYDRNGTFTLYSSSMGRGSKGMANMLLHGFPIAALFPRYAHSFLRQLGQHLGYRWENGTLHMDLRSASEFILCVYREFAFTGHQAHLNALFPEVRRLVDSVLRADHNRDGLPDAESAGTVPDACATGLWLAALQSYARLARTLGLKEDASRCEDSLRRAAASYDLMYWDVQKRFYRLHAVQVSIGQEHPLAAMHSLAGEAYAELFGFGFLLPLEKIEFSLAHIEGILRENDEIVLPGHSRQALAGWIAPLLIRHGHVDAAMRILAICRRESGDSPERATGVSELPEDEMDVNIAALGLWQLYYAFPGFHYDVPWRTLTIMPCIPGAVKNLSAPLITSLCLGSLNYQEYAGDSYQQNIQLVFDSPLTIERLRIRVPSAFSGSALSVQCYLSEQILPCTQQLEGKDSQGRCLSIVFKPPVMAAGTLRCSIHGKP